MSDITHGRYIRTAAINRGLASTQALLDAIEEKCTNDRGSLVTEYWALDTIAQRMSKGYTILPEDRIGFKKVLTRMKEINRCIVVLDETAEGARLSYDSDPAPVGDDGRQEDNQLN